MAQPPLVNMNITAGTREGVRQLAYTLTGEAGRRVTLDAAMAAAVAVAMAHLPEAVAQVAAAAAGGAQ